MVFASYVDRVCADIRHSQQIAVEMGGKLASLVDSIYLGGGTPTLLDPDHLKRIFAAVHSEFAVSDDAEVTVECAPGTLSPELIETLLSCGVNRMSLGVQSFIDREAASIGRLHKRDTVFDDIALLRAAGISNINIDLIAGLPHQTAASWKKSLEETIGTGAPHTSVYMLEVDEDSRLGRELIAGGTRYHAHFVPSEEAVADFYLAACEELDAGNIRQYEISNFARPEFESRHNLKYWSREPYLGFGVDAHSMLHALAPEFDAVRFSTSDSLESFTGGESLHKTIVTPTNALEENLFLGLRLNRGVDLQKIADHFGSDSLAVLGPIIKQLEANNLADASGNILRLTARGRLLSNEVFQQFLDFDEISTHS